MSDPVTPLTPSQTAAAEAKAAKEPYLEREAIALDIFADETADSPMDETISSRWARWSKMGGVRGLIGRVGSRALDVFQRNHGAQAAAGDVERAKTLIATEEKSGLIDEEKP